jgi:hypothetical protein
MCGEKVAGCRAWAVNAQDGGAPVGEEGAAEGS